jgi:threonine/homoserine/homoserine lactone efflux protein
MLRTLGKGVDICVTATLLDGVVLARSVYKSSLNYRSVVVVGRARPVDDGNQKRAALAAVVEHVAHRSATRCTAAERRGAQGHDSAIPADRLGLGEDTQRATRRLRARSRSAALGWSDSFGFDGRDPRDGGARSARRPHPSLRQQLQAAGVAVMRSLSAFFVVAVVVIVTPGPDTALTIRNTLVGGRRSGVFTGVGVAAGQATWTVATSVGIAALLVASEPIFRAIKYAGVIYLVLLGLQALRTAASRGECPTAAGDERVPLSSRVALRHGLISNLTNPKMIAFFPALLPQFMPHERGAVAVLLVLGLVFSTMTLLWLSGYAYAVAKAGDVIRQGRVRRGLQGLTGCVLIGLGVRIATDGTR